MHFYSICAVRYLEWAGDRKWKTFITTFTNWTYNQRNRTDLCGGTPHIDLTQVTVTPTFFPCKFYYHNIMFQSEGSNTHISHISTPVTRITVQPRIGEFPSCNISQGIILSKNNIFLGYFYNHYSYPFTNSNVCINSVVYNIVTTNVHITINNPGD